MQLVLAVTLLSLVSASDYSNATIEYYVQLINSNIESAENFVLPTSNEEFRIKPGSSQPQHYGDYDFIIVGAGSSGNVVATRLTEIRDWKILLLEAGGEETDFSDIPAMFPYSQFSRMNWGYYTTPQKTCCLGMRGNRCNYPRGKVIGGCSTINALIYARGNRRDFDIWQELGNPGWSYNDVLPYFIKSENSQIEGDPGYHGEHGLWNVAYSNPEPRTLPNFIAGNEEMGLKYLDYNGAHQHGTSRIQANIRNGRRQSTGRAFLDTTRKSRNLNVTTDALVTKILIEKRCKVAKGVTFTRRGRTYVANARREVIVSAGAINSPQLLMLSGIGPRDHLRSLGIDVIQDLPVGFDLQDHPTFYGITIRTNYTVDDNILTDQIRQYLSGIGPLTNPGNSAGLAFLQPDDGPKSYPDLEYIFIPSNSTAQVQGRVYNFNDEIVNNYINRINPMTDVRIYLLLLHPASKGRLTLQSRDPIDFPNIDVNYFSDPNDQDLETVYRGIQVIMKLIETEAFRKINATFLEVPVCRELERNSREYWYCVIRHMTATIYHPMRTTQMGPDRAKSVVDYNLKVHGVKKLRVVDCGVFPFTLSGHNNAAAVMVGEKISDTIKKDYGY